MIEPSMLDCCRGAGRTDCDCATPDRTDHYCTRPFRYQRCQSGAAQRFSPLYFSRSPIPCVRDRSQRMAEALIHSIDISASMPIAIMPWRRFVDAAPSSLRDAEQLEQLRMLDLVCRSLCVETEYAGHAVDTPEDVMQVEALMGEVSKWCTTEPRTTPMASGSYPLRSDN